MRKTPSPSIRLATLADAEMLSLLAARTFYDAFVETNTRENLKAYMDVAFSIETVASELADPQATFLIAEVEPSPAGYAKLFQAAPPECAQHRPALEIVRLYVEQRFHGGGVAHALMQACLDHAGQAGANGVFLGVWEHNPRAQAFYRKWGFEIIGSHIFQMGHDPQTDYWMERKL
jgi:ribosomal protein S18 acetylase RimI-like enzyme